MLFVQWQKRGDGVTEAVTGPGGGKPTEYCVPTKAGGKLRRAHYLLPLYVPLPGDGHDLTIATADRMTAWLW